MIGAIFAVAFLSTMAIAYMLFAIAIDESF